MPTNCFVLATNQIKYIGLSSVSTSDNKGNNINVIDKINNSDDNARTNWC